VKKAMGRSGKEGGHQKSILRNGKQKANFHRKRRRSRGKDVLSLKIGGGTGIENLTLKLSHGGEELREAKKKEQEARLQKGDCVFVFVGWGG